MHARDAEESHVRHYLSLDRPLDDCFHVRIMRGAESEINRQSACRGLVSGLRLDSLRANRMLIQFS